ncbi:MAG: hypothetical protein AMXMBFR58_36580 [Phycisphaerae bacterium]
MASNFDFLKPQHADLAAHAAQAEALTYSAPRASCFYARFALEAAVQWLYKNDPALDLPYDHQLGALVHEQTFKDNLPPGLFAKVRTIVKVGNQAAHDQRPLTSRDSAQVVGELFHFLYWLSRSYSANAAAHPTVTFNLGLLPKPAQEGKDDLTLAQLQKLEKEKSQAEEMLRIAEERSAKTEAEIASLKSEIAALKKANDGVPDTHDYSEAKTRKYLIDVLLKEARWPIHLPEWTEYEVTGMPNDTGTGYVDYVLWGDDGKPLALVEAKKTTFSAAKGKKQACLYADCLQVKFGRRPVIFYSNGYEHWIWDDVRYPPRPIQGFLKKDELELLHYRRTNRKGLHLVQPDKAIVERTYQHEAIRRITETFDEKNGRKALLVMATGTGKTRTVIALVDLLRRADWAKRVLFLADRNALLIQALRAFKAHLPSAVAVDLTKSDASNAAVILSTYPTMLNRINDVVEGERQFGPGYFDLVIVDEAHRSIYKKYGAIFDYFDGLLVGLTATPRSEVHRDTYRTFDLEPGVPSFAYELNDAVGDGYLVPPRGVTVPFKFIQKGVKYADLSDDEKEEYEEKLADDDGNLPARVDAEALNKWLFNIDTVDKAIELVMTKGIRVADGEKLGKTIIFARNHKHAEFIVERFDKNYPKYKGKFAQVIDSHNDYAQALLDDFSDPAKEPTIAVSVDMLDTGVDVPEVVNLVFFKPVYSRVKFNQMIGRGTRLCRDLLGPGKDKAEFLVFDLCGNLEYFEQELPEADPSLADGLTARIVRARTEVVLLMGKPGEPDDKPELPPGVLMVAEPKPPPYILPGTDEAVRHDILGKLHQHVATMEPQNFLVRRHLRTVEEFSERERWDRLTEADAHTIGDVLAPLPNGLPPEDVLAQQFDLLCLKIQISLLSGGHGFEALRDKVRDLADRLEAKKNVPMVAEHIELIVAIQAEEWWTDVTLPMVEDVRRKLRGLIQFIDRTARPPIITDFEDEMGDVEDKAVPVTQTGFSPYQYRKKVERYIRENENHVVVAKLKRNLPLTPADLASLESMLFDSPEVESRERFEQVFGKDLSLVVFIRKLVGLDRAAAKQAFAVYLDGAGFGANQIRFVETVIDYLTQNGVMDPGILYEPPFTDFHYEGLDGVFPSHDHADNIVSIIRSFNESVGMKFGAIG